MQLLADLGVKIIIEPYAECRAEIVVVRKLVIKAEAVRTLADHSTDDTVLIFAEISVYHGPAKAFIESAAKLQTAYPALRRKFFSCDSEVFGNDVVEVAVTHVKLSLRESHFVKLRRRYIFSKVEFNVPHSRKRRAVVKVGRSQTDKVTECAVELFFRVSNVSKTDK